MSAMPASTPPLDVPGKPRNLVLMLDGTSNQFSERNSNLIKLMSVVKADEGQLLFYSSGLGTILPDSASTWGIFKQKAAEVIDMGLAWNFDQFVQDGYKWLMDNYRDGDKIYLFGFSRGAYTARALAGMIQRVGLLNPGNHNQVSPAYELYTSEIKWKDANGEAKDPAVLYRRIFGRSRPVTVEFLGVWDTVSSLGGIDLPQLPFASGAKSIKFFRQALALDERRARFVPEYWRMDDEELALRRKIRHLRSTIAHHPGTSEAEQAKDAIDAISAQLTAQYPQTDYAVLSDGTKKEMRKHAEVWFMGCHSDVGGGNDLNDQPSLSNIPFRWMVREAVRVGLVLNPCGVALQTALALPQSLILRSSLDLQVDQGLVASSSNNTPDGSTPLDPRLDAVHKLAKILREQDDDPKKGIDGWAECKPYTAQLPQSVLAEIVEAAAKLDAFPDGADGANLGPSVAPARAGAGGSELSADAKKPFTESLTLAWKPVEGMLLSTRHYTPEGAKRRNVVRMNLGRGRQIIPEQMLHRSVGLRMIYDTEKASQDRSLRDKGYFAPHASVAAGWPSWEDIAQGKASDSDVWEE